MSGVCLVAAVVILVVVGVSALTRHRSDAARTGDTSGPDASAGGTTQPLGGEADPAPTGFGSVAVTIADAAGKRASWCLLLADNEARQAQGLMWVTDPSLAGYDGMVFTFGADSTDRFWMRNTPQELSIAYFAGDGSFVSAARMYPCGDHANCPTYPAARPYRYAIEVPAGNLGRLGIGEQSRIVLPEPGTAKACTPRRTAGGR